MKIDYAKPPQLLSAIMAIALATSTVGCGGTSGSEQATPTSQIPRSARSVIPPSCGVPAEAIRPPSLASREGVATYQGGIVVNMAGTIANILVDVPNLIRINHDPTLGLSLPEHINVTYFFTGSLSRPDALNQIGDFYQAHKFYLSARYCQEQGAILDRFLLVAISVGDARDKVTSTNPILPRGSNAWNLALERELGERYILGTRVIIDGSLHRPITRLSDTIIDRVLAAGLPFRILRLTENRPLFS